MHIDQDCDPDFRADAITGTRTGYAAQDDGTDRQLPEPEATFQPQPLNPFYWGCHPGESRKDAEARREKAALDSRRSTAADGAALHGHSVTQAVHGNLEIVGWMSPSGQILTEKKRQELLSDPEQSWIVKNNWGTAKPLVVINGDPTNPAGFAKISAPYST